MIAEEREAAILALLQERGVVSTQTLVERCRDVSAVTLRRDLSRLESQGRLQRTHGGAINVKSPDAIVTSEPDEMQRLFDGLVLPPISGRWAHTLRQQAMRRGIPFLAESAPQVGGVYLGPMNHAASRQLGMRAGREHGDRSPTAELLLITLEALPNTRERVEGFLAGFTETFPGRLISHRVDGRGTFKEAMQQTREAFRTRPTIDVVFGVNDHTILGALEVARQLGAPVAGYSVGGEGGALLDELARGGLLKATLSLFPEVVGRLAVDTICRRFAGEECGEAIITPVEILTSDTLGNFYRHVGDQWRIRPEVLDRMCGGRLYSGPSVAGRSIGFMLHYPSHEWYRNLAAAMRKRCAEFSVRFVARNAEDEVAEQLRGIRRVIATAAAARVRPRDTLLIDGGECSRYFAEALKSAGREATVVTNSLAVLDALVSVPGVKVLLTAGEYQPATRSLVGPSVSALRDTIRVDKAFVSPDGVSPSFGLSFEDERAALVCRRFCEVAREVIVLADPSVVGLESNVQAVRPKQFHTVLTDAGALSSHRFDLFAVGLRVIVADEENRLSRSQTESVQSRDLPREEMKMSSRMMYSAALAAMGLWIMASGVHADQTVLRFWDNQQTESGLSKYQQEAVKRFGAENPDIKVEVTTIPYPEYQQRLLTAVQAGNGPDVSTVDQIWNSAFAEAGAIVPLDDLAKKSGVKPETFFPGAWESANYKGNLWGVPFNVDVWFFAFVNKKLFSDAGVDPASIVTWDGLEAAAEKLTDKSKGQYAIGLTGNKSEYPVVMTDSFIYSNGGSVLDDKGKCALTAQPAIEALDFYKTLAAYAPAGILNAADEQMRELFLNGTLAIELWPALEQPTLDKTKLDWDLLAGFAPKGKKPVGTYGGWNLVLYKGAKDQDAAWKFIEFMTREDVNGAVVDLIPANVAAAKAFLEKSRRHPDVILDHLNNAKPRPLSPRYLEVSEIQQNMVQKILSGTPTADAAKEACAAIDVLH